MGHDETPINPKNKVVIGERGVKPVNRNHIDRIQRGPQFALLMRCLEEARAHGEWSFRVKTDDVGRIVDYWWAMRTIYGRMPATLIRVAELMEQGLTIEEIGGDSERLLGVRIRKLETLGPMAAAALAWRLTCTDLSLPCPSASAVYPRLVKSADDPDWLKLSDQEL